MVFEIQPELAFEIVMMQSVVRHIIKKITWNESDEERKNVYRTYQRFKEKEKSCSKRNTHRWHHYQTLWIARIIMMNTMENEVNLFTESSRRHPVKNKTVENIFRQGPDKQSESDVCYYIYYWKMKFNKRPEEEIQNYRNKNNQWNSKVDACKFFEPWVLKHLNSFVLVADKILCHDICLLWAKL